MSFTAKKIELTITLGSGQFGEDVGDTVTISQARIQADLANPGGESMGSAQIRVWGLSESLMNKLTTIGQINRAIRIKNTVAVAAGDENGMQLAFFGVIVDAFAEYNGAPDVPFVIMAQMGLDVAIKPVGATSYKGSASVEEIMYGFANEAGLAFENNNVDAQLFNPYFPGTTLSKIQACARAAGIEYVIDRGTLAIWPSGLSREGDVPTISVDSGMYGYPTLSSKGMTVRTQFNLNIKIGADIDVESAIPMARGRWHVYSTTHNITAELPDGPWFTTVEAYRVEQ